MLTTGREREEEEEGGGRGGVRLWNNTTHPTNSKDPLEVWGKNISVMSCFLLSIKYNYGLPLNETTAHGFIQNSSVGLQLNLSVSENESLSGRHPETALHVGAQCINNEFLRAQIKFVWT